MAMKRQGAPASNPNAQTYGSAFDVFVLNKLAAEEPITTPKIPARHVIAPKINETLHKKICQTYFRSEVECKLLKLY